LIQHIYEEADIKSIEKGLDNPQENTAMMANKGKGKWKGRGGKSKLNEDLHCTNCKLDGHVKEDCYAKGGGQEASAPDWWKRKQERKKRGKSTANVAEEVTEEDPDDYAFTATLPVDEDPNIALTATSDFRELHADQKPSCGIIIDCGASRHFSPDRAKFINYREIPPTPIQAANGQAFDALGKGDIVISLPMSQNQSPIPITLKNVYYSPRFALTLISVAVLDRAGCELRIKDGCCVILNPKSHVIGRIPLTRGLYRAYDPNSTPPPKTRLLANSASKLMTINELHRIMGHINHDDLRMMVRKGLVTGVELDDSKPAFCKICVEAKASRLPFPKQSPSEPLKAYGEKVVTDFSKTVSPTKKRSTSSGTRTKPSNIINVMRHGSRSNEGP